MHKLLVVAVTLAVAQAATVNRDCVASQTVASGTHAPSEICSGDIIFQDEFDSLDFKRWQHEQTLGGGGVSTFYSGTLSLYGGAPADECTNNAFYGCERTGSATNVLNPIKSARIRTLNSFSFRYGRVEVKAKVPHGDWLWPAIWMMPRDNVYSSWPSSGEIDIMESRGNENLVQNGVNIGTHMVGSTLHWGPDYYTNRYEYTHFDKVEAVGYDQDFHVYGVEWTPEHIKFSIDDVELGTITPPEGGFWELGNLASSGYANPWEGSSKMAPFDQEFYIIINLAVGGTAYFPDDATNADGSKPWLNTSPTASTDFWEGRSSWLPTWNLDGSDDAALQVDYVRVYAL